MRTLLILQLLSLSSFASFERLLFDLREGYGKTPKVCDLRNIQEIEKPLLFIFEGTFQYDLNKLHYYKTLEKLQKYSNYKMSNFLISSRQYGKYTKIQKKYLSKKNFGIINFFIEKLVRYNKKKEGWINFYYPNRTGYHLLYFPQNGIKEASKCYDEISKLKLSIKDKRKKIQVMGFSWGSYEALKFSNFLKRKGQKIHSLMTLDAVPKSLGAMSKANWGFGNLSNIKSWNNYYQRQTKGLFSLQGAIFQKANLNKLIKFRSKVAHLAHDAFPRARKMRGEFMRFYSKHLFD